MARVYKRKSDRERGLSGKWTGVYKDETGVRVSFAGSTDKEATLAEANLRERNARLVRSGAADPAKARYQKAAARPIVELIEEYREFQLGRKVTAKHVLQTNTHLKRLAKLGEIKSVHDLTTGRIAEALTRLPAELSARTRNFSRTAVFAFAKWLCDADKIEHPIKGQKQIQAEAIATDRRVERRALTHDELSRLLCAAADGPPVRLSRRDAPEVAISGPERALVWNLVASTGIRANELRMLVPDDFRLHGPTPSIAIGAGIEKARRGAKQPLPGRLVEPLRAHLATRRPHQPAFNLPERMAKLLRHDLAAAGIAAKNHRGEVVDFHALRTTFVTHLIQGGTSLVHAQKLARHSTPDLTANAYGKLTPEDLHAEINRAPRCANDAREGPQKAENVHTGTPNVQSETTNPATQTPQPPID